MIYVVVTLRQYMSRDGAIPHKNNHLMLKNRYGKDGLLFCFVLIRRVAERPMVPKPATDGNEVLHEM